MLGFTTSLHIIKYNGQYTKSTSLLSSPISINPLTPSAYIYIYIFENMICLIDHFYLFIFFDYSILSFLSISDLLF